MQYASGVIWPKFLLEYFKHGLMITYSCPLNIINLLLQHGCSFWFRCHVLIGEWHGWLKQCYKCNHFWTFLCISSRWSFQGKDLREDSSFFSTESHATFSFPMQVVSMDWKGIVFDMSPMENIPCIHIKKQSVLHSCFYLEIIVNHGLWQLSFGFTLANAEINFFAVI